MQDLEFRLLLLNTGCLQRVEQIRRSSETLSCVAGVNNKALALKHWMVVIVESKEKEGTALKHWLLLRALKPWNI